MGAEITETPDWLGETDPELEGKRVTVRPGTLSPCGEPLAAWACLPGAAVQRVRMQVP